MAYRYDHQAQTNARLTGFACPPCRHSDRAVSVFLIVDFGIRAANLIQANQLGAAVSAQLVQEMDYRDRLQQRLDYVQSDAYVEEVARTQLKWSRPGETVVVIVSPPAVAPAIPKADQPPAVKPTSEQPAWKQWWNIFFEGDPPRLF